MGSKNFGLVVFDSLLSVSSPAYRLVVAGLLRTAAGSAQNESRRTILLAAADAIKAGMPSARTPNGLTAMEAAARSTVMEDQWHPPVPAPAEPARVSPPRLNKPAMSPRARKATLTKAQFKELNTRKVSVLQVGGFRPTFDPAASNFGLAPLGLPEEEWPTWNSKPLLFVCQMNLVTAPAVPQLLADIHLISFYVDPELGILQKENGADWRLRTYTSLEGLVPIPAPVDAPKVKKGFECRWEEGEDHPNYDDPDIVIPAGSRPLRVELENLARTKIGGYLSSIQSEPWWELEAHPSHPKYCLQINSEPKAGLNWGDGGTIYLARGTVPGSGADWFLDWQCF